MAEVSDNDAVRSTVTCSIVVWSWFAFHPMEMSFCASAAVAGSGSNVTAIITANAVLTSLLLKFVMCMVLLLL